MFMLCDAVSTVYAITFFANDHTEKKEVYRVVLQTAVIFALRCKASIKSILAHTLKTLKARKRQRQRCSARKRNSHAKCIHINCTFCLI